MGPGERFVGFVRPLHKVERLQKRSQLKPSCPEGQGREAEDSVAQNTHGTPAPWGAELALGACGGERSASPPPRRDTAAPQAQPGASSPLLAPAPRAEGAAERGWQ